MEDKNINKRRIITIGGQPGSGKSSASSSVAQVLGYKRFSSGEMMRQLGAERNLKILDTNRAANDDAMLDELVDGALKGLANENEIVIDSRMAWHWMGSRAFNVFLDLSDPIVAAGRIISNMDKDRILMEHVPKDPVKYSEHLKERRDLEAERYVSKYGVDPFLLTNYDLVVDTIRHSKEETVQIIVEEYKRWLLKSNKS